MRTTDPDSYSKAEYCVPGALYIVSSLAESPHSTRLCFELRDGIMRSIREDDVCEGCVCVCKREWEREKWLEKCLVAWCDVGSGTYL